MCVYCSKLKENDSKRIYVQINTYRVYIDIPYTFINCSLNSFDVWLKDAYLLNSGRGIRINM